MANSVKLDGWRVKILGLPTSVTSEELSKTWTVAKSRINIPKIQKRQTFYAWVHDFSDEDSAKKFVSDNSKLTISGFHPNFTVLGPKTQGTNRPQQSSEESDADDTVVVSTTRTRDQSAPRPQYPPGNPEHERKLCSYANKGNCRYKDRECKYRYERCKDYDSCSNTNCLLAHAPSASAMSVRTGMSCRNGNKCYNFDCSFQHPEGWKPCKYKQTCTDYECTLIHPPGRKKPCRDGITCKNSNCRFAHPQPIESSIELSGAQYDFLQSFGKEALNKIRQQSDIEDMQVKDGKLQLKGIPSILSSIRSILDQTLHEENVTIPTNLSNYLKFNCKGFLLNKFVKKYHVGISYLEILANTSAGANNDQNDSEEEEGWDDGKSDVSDTSSTGASVCSNVEHTRRRGQKFIQVALCSDSKESVSKAVRELKAYDLHIQSWALSPDEIKYIIEQLPEDKPTQKGKYPKKNAKKPAATQQCSQVKSYFFKLVQGLRNIVVQIFVNQNKGVWRVKVRGFQDHVNKAVSQIQNALSNNVKIEVKLPISKVMAIFLQKKASSDVKKLEKTHSIKITVASPKRDKHVNAADEEENDERDCLKLNGTKRCVDSAQMHIENFLESLSEQEKEFACPSWDTSKNISPIICKQLQKIMQSDDCEAIGWVKSYSATERREMKPNINVSIVGFNEEAVDNVVEQCQNIVSGYEVWKPSTDEYRNILNALLVKKAPSIDQFQQQWDVKLHLEKDTSTITISAQSKMLADEVKEALLNLGKETKTQVKHISLLIPIEPKIRRFVNSAIESLLDEAKAQKVFIENKNREGLKLHGHPDRINELQQKINSVINDIQQKIIIRRLELSLVESDFLRCDSYKIINAIERETKTGIRDITADASNTASNTDDDSDSSSIITTVVNDRGQNIVVKKGDITKARNVDAIVNAANGPLYHAGGVDKAIADAAGPALDQECKQIIAKNGGLPISAGKAVKTTAGKLPFKCVIHAIGPQYKDGNQQEHPLLFFAVLSSLRLAEEEQCRSIALPAISSHTYGFPLADCTNIVIRAVKQFFADYPRSNVKNIILLDMDDAACNSFAREVIVDHRCATGDVSDNVMNYNLPPLTAKWCWQDDDGEKINDENHTRQIEAAFQDYLHKGAMPTLVLSADNLRSGIIVNYSIHFAPDLKQSLTTNPNALNGRLVCGHQMRQNTGYQRNIIRYPVVQKIQSASVTYSPKPLDLYHMQISKAKVGWNITGMSTEVVKQAEIAIRKAIDAATISEPYSVSLGKNVDAHKEQIQYIADEQQIEIDFQQVGAGQLPMILKGLKPNVQEAKLKITLYAHSILQQQVEKDDELNTPKEWGDQTEKCKLVEIPKNDPTFTRIENRMKETLSSVRIDKIERVQNLRMWTNYAIRRRELKNKLNVKPNLQIEMELFHGTRTTTPSEVYNGEYGFDMTFSTSGMWGIGSYFAKNASYSCGGYEHTLPNGKRQVFLANVLTGDVYDCPSDSSLRRPPKKTDSDSGLRYDSVSGTTGGSKVYIVYENRVAYPTYLITFSV